MRDKIMKTIEYSSCEMEDASTTSKVKRIVDKTGQKRRVYSVVHKDPKQSSRRFRANDRERRRMNSLNCALQALKRCVPLYHGKKRTTKLQILQFASNYISDLSDILCDPTSAGNVHIEEDRFSHINSIMEFMSEQSCNDSMDDVTGPITNVNGVNLMQRLDYISYYNQKCHFSGITNSFGTINSYGFGYESGNISDVAYS